MQIMMSIIDYWQQREVLSDGLHTRSFPHLTSDRWGEMLDALGTSILATARVISKAEETSDDYLRLFVVQERLVRV